MSATTLLSALVPEGGEHNWTIRSACKNEDPELFFPPENSETTATLLQIRDAKNVCAGCHVRAECLAEALAVDDRYSISGGLTPEERRALSRRSGAAS